MSEEYRLQVVRNAMKNVATTFLCSILLVMMSFSPAMVFEPSDNENLGKKDVSSTSQAQQPDNDGDGTDDFNDPDDDNDGYDDSLERDCGSDPLNPMSTPTYSDKDDLCDGIDLDDDNDGYSDLEEIDCNSDPLDNDDIPLDSDGDGYCDALDDSPNDPNEWSDFDGDGIGDNADPDDDNDGVLDSEDAFPFDRCVAADWDGDGLPDYVLSQDCIFRYGGEIDPDDDNDGVLDYADDLPLDPCSSVDTDGDGSPDFIHIDKNCDQALADNDDDNDGYPDKGDAFPTDPSEWLDTDGDGIGNNADQNDDGDGWSDLFELLCETDPFDITDYPLDTDGDGHCDFLDTDDDNDGILDVNDPEPLETEGSWEWATGAGNMIKINDMAMDSNGDIFVTGSYKGQTTLGGFNLGWAPEEMKSNTEDVFVAKMDDQGNWLWVQSSRAVPKWCANDDSPTWSSTTTSSGSGGGLISTGVVTDWGQNFSAFPNEIEVNDIDFEPANANFSAGDYVYLDTLPVPTFVGVVSSATSNRLYLVANIVPEAQQSMYGGEPLMKLNPGNIAYSSTFSIGVAQGGFEKVVWQSSYGEGNSIALDDQGNAYITGNFAGFIGFGSSNSNELESYNVRNEGNWIRNKYTDTNNLSWKLSGYPCGAPSDFSNFPYVYGNHNKDIFIAKISSSGSWEWANGAGGPWEDTGDHIVISSDGSNAFISGKLRHEHFSALGDRTRGCGELQHVGDTPNFWNGEYPVKNHKGMFGGDGSLISQLEGCGAYIAKFKLSNGHWQDRVQLSPPTIVLQHNGALNPARVNPSCAYTCSDALLEITGMVSMGDPERLYITGKFAKSVQIDGHSASTPSAYDETWFIAKLSWNLDDFDWLIAGQAGPHDYQIHDIATNGVWDLAVSGCKDGGKFVGMLNGDGNWHWTENFDNQCSPTVVTFGQDGVYASGVYSWDDSIIFDGTTLQHSAPVESGHFVAHWDFSGNFIWAEDNLHLLQNSGTNSNIISANNVPPTGIIVDSNNRVYTCGYIEGGSHFKNVQIYGDTSYVAAIDGPLIVVEPSIIIDHDNDSGASIPNLSLLSTLIMMLFAALYSRRNN